MIEFAERRSQHADEKRDSRTADHCIVDSEMMDLEKVKDTKLRQK